tara:strand:+ start:260 stop:889 length:630 start_codon:yes stop_codon:yes gene_type:complete
LISNKKISQENYFKDYNSTGQQLVNKYSNELKEYNIKLLSKYIEEGAAENFIALFQITKININSIVWNKVTQTNGTFLDLLISYDKDATKENATIARIAIAKFLLDNEINIHQIPSHIYVSSLGSNKSVYQQCESYIEQQKKVSTSSLIDDTTQSQSSYNISKHLHNLCRFFISPTDNFAPTTTIGSNIYPIITEHQLFTSQRNLKNCP